MKIFLFKNGIPHDSETGSYVSYLDHMEAIAEKDAEILGLSIQKKDLERIVERQAHTRKTLLLNLDTRIAEVKRLREALTEILKYPEERASYGIAEKALEKK